MILKQILEPAQSKPDRKVMARVSNKMRMKNQARVDLMIKFASQGVPDSSSAALTSRYRRKARKRKREKENKSEEFTKNPKLENMIQSTLDFKMRN